jgi:cytochrome P450
MSTLSLPTVPPAPRVHAKDLPTWRLVLEFSRNNVATMAEDAFDTLIRRRRVFGIDTLAVSDPDGVWHVLATAAAKYKRPMAAHRILRPLGGQGVLLAEQAEWRRQRRMLAPVFTPTSVDLLLPHFRDAAVDLIRRIEDLPRANLSAAFQETTLEAVLRALFSLPDSSRRHGLASMVRGYLTGPGRPNALDGFVRTEDGFAFALRKRRRFQVAWRAVVDGIVAERRLAQASSQRDDLLDLLLAARDAESGEALSDTEVRDQCATMLVAGYETTARLLFWACYLLTLDVAEQARLRAEILAFSPERVAKLDDLLKWPRLRQMLLETLRLYPPVPQISREAIADDIVVGEPVRPRTQIWISPWVMHRHRKFWDNPTAFMPDRFAGKPSPWSAGSAFLPFGVGPRICIGATFALAEAQIILATLLSRFNLTLDAARPVLPVGKVTTAPSFEPMFQLERR